MRPRSTPGTITSLGLVYRWLAPLSLICFVAAVFTDWAYAATANIQYSNYSAWLLLFGLIAGGITLALLLLSFFGSWLERGPLWLATGLFFVGFVIEIVNFMVHNRDGWTTVVPTGITLSIIGALVLLVAGWFGRTPLTIGRTA